MHLLTIKISYLLIINYKKLIILKKFVATNTNYTSSMLLTCDRFMQYYHDLPGTFVNSCHNHHKSDKKDKIRLQNYLADSDIHRLRDGVSVLLGKLLLTLNPHLKLDSIDCRQWYVVSIVIRRQTKVFTVVVMYPLP